MNDLDEPFDETDYRPRWRETVRPRQATGLRGWWRRTSAGEIFLLTLAVSFGLPVGVFFFGVIAAYVMTGG